ncbi:MAG: chromate transporter [Ignavibacteriales bacterium CG_4_9_14_3_um_filter_30_11]|nr:MAG: chromate transporter [Ignavibacteriales bacterium CG_4_9_14_3_um_filter_30_11]
MLVKLFSLFISFLKVGSFSFGGAYSLFPLIEKEVVQNHHWLQQDEFLKVLGLVEVFPGAISIKYATYTGFKVAGVLGVIAANLGNIIMPATVIMLAIYFLDYFHKNEIILKAFDGIKYAVIGMVAALLYQYSTENVAEIKGVLLILIGFSLVFFLKLHPAYVVIIAAVVSLIIL